MFYYCNTMFTTFREPCSENFLLGILNIVVLDVYIMLNMCPNL